MGIIPAFVPSRLTIFIGVRFNQNIWIQKYLNKMGEDNR